MQIQFPSSEQNKIKITFFFVISLFVFYQKKKTGVVGKEHTTIKLKDPDRLIDAASVSSYMSVSRVF